MRGSSGPGTRRESDNGGGAAGSLRAVTQPGTAKNAHTAASVTPASIPF